MNLQEIHDMAADALAGEELQFRDNNGGWHDYTPNCVQAFGSQYHWRIKPTIEVNGVMMSKRQAKAAWGISGATDYAYMYDHTNWCLCTNSAPMFEQHVSYRWQEPKWIYVNGEKIVRSGGEHIYRGYAMGSQEDVEKLRAAIHKLIEIK